MAEIWVKRLMLGTDLGFLAYWVATATGLIPPYPHHILIDWNWSYLLLDLVASATGLTALWLSHRASDSARSLMLISLALTHAAGLTALNFWALRGEFAPAWWLPNLWLTVFPVVGVFVLLYRPHAQRSVSPPR